MCFTSVHIIPIHVLVSAFQFGGDNGDGFFFFQRKRGLELRPAFIVSIMVPLRVVLNFWAPWCLSLVSVFFSFAVNGLFFPPLPHSFLRSLIVAPQLARIQDEPGPLHLLFQTFPGNFEPVLHCQMRLSMTPQVEGPCAPFNSRPSSLSPNKSAVDYSI